MCITCNSSPSVEGDTLLIPFLLLLSDSAYLLSWGIEHALRRSPVSGSNVRILVTA